MIGKVNKNVILCYHLKKMLFMFIQMLLHKLKLDRKIKYNHHLFRINFIQMILQQIKINLQILKLNQLTEIYSLIIIKILIQRAIKLILRKNKKKMLNIVN